MEYLNHDEYLGALKLADKLVDRVEKRIQTANAIQISFYMEFLRDIREAELELRDAFDEFTKMQENYYKKEMDNARGLSDSNRI